MDEQGRQAHDWLLKHKPAEASHDFESCLFCTQAPEQEEDVSAEQKIFTQEQHEQLLASAVEKAVADAQSATDKEILRLNEQLEESQAALAERDEKVVELSAAITAREETDRLEALAIERVKLVKAEANFSDEQIQERRMSWAKMEEGVFAAYLEDIKTVAKTAKEPPKDDKPPKTDFDGTRETAGEDGTEKSVVKRFFGEGLVTATQL